MIIVLPRNTMSNRVFTFLQITFFAVSSLFVVYTGYAIAITEKKCASHDWPVESHDINIKWCVDNGYEV